MKIFEQNFWWIKSLVFSRKNPLFPLDLHTSDIYLKHRTDKHL